MARRKTTTHAPVSTGTADDDLDAQVNMVKPFGFGRVQNTAITQAAKRLGGHAHWDDTSVHARPILPRLALAQGISGGSTRHGAPAEGLKPKTLKVAYRHSPSAVARSLEQNQKALQLLEDRRIRDKLDETGDRIFQEQWAKLQKQREYEQAEWARAEAAGIFNCGESSCFSNSAFDLRQGSRLTASSTTLDLGSDRSLEYNDPA